jgi:hypothetical protein
MSINSISVSEPIGVSKTATFTVSLHHPSSQEIRVNFATRDGNGKRKVRHLRDIRLHPECRHVGHSGSTASVTNLTGTIGVTIVGDTFTEPDEQFFVDLSAPVQCDDRGCAGRRDDPRHQAVDRRIRGESGRGKRCRRGEAVPY